METKATPELLSRLNEIVERSRMRRDKRIPHGEHEKPADTIPDMYQRPPYPRRGPGRS